MENKNIVDDVQKRYQFIEKELKSKRKNIQFCIFLIFLFVLVPIFCVGYFIRLNSIYEINNVINIAFLILLLVFFIGLAIASPGFGPTSIFLEILNNKVDARDLKLYRALLKRLEDNENYKISDVFYNEVIFSPIYSNKKLKLKLSGVSISENDISSILDKIEKLSNEDTLDMEIAKGCYLKNI